VHVLWLQIIVFLIGTTIKSGEHFAFTELAFVVFTGLFIICHYRFQQKVRQRFFGF